MNVDLASLLIRGGLPRPSLNTPTASPFTANGYQPTDVTSPISPMQLGAGLQNMSRPSFLNPELAKPVSPFGADPSKNSTIDNIAELGGLALGTYGAYKQGQTADKQLKMQQQQIDEENRRYQDERDRKAGAAQQLSPQVKMMLDELNKQIAAQAAGAR